MTELDNWSIEFDKEFPNSRGIFEDGDPYNLRRNAIKNFIDQQITLAKAEERKQILELLPEEQILHTYMLETFKDCNGEIQNSDWWKGWNEYRNQIMLRIK